MIIHDPKIRRLRRVRQKINHNKGIPRLSVYRSNQHLWAQIIDDLHGKTLASGNTKVLKTKSTKTEKAYTLGQEIAKMAKTAKVTHVRFDRGLSSYHGRVESFAKGARDGGLKF